VRRARSPIVVLFTALTFLLSIAAPAFAQDPGRWLLTGASSVPVPYWQGLTSDPAKANLYFAGALQGAGAEGPTLRLSDLVSVGVASTARGARIPRSGAG
jgi:hypothetical protein